MWLFWPYLGTLSAVLTQIWYIVRSLLPLTNTTNLESMTGSILKNQPVNKTQLIPIIKVLFIFFSILFIFLYQSFDNSKLNDWCLMPNFIAFQLYREVNKLYQLISLTTIQQTNSTKNLIVFFGKKYGKKLVLCITSQYDK